MVGHDSCKATATSASASTALSTQAEWHARVTELVMSIRYLFKIPAEAGIEGNGYGSAYKLSDPTGQDLSDANAWWRWRQINSITKPLHM